MRPTMTPRQAWPLAAGVLIWAGVGAGVSAQPVRLHGATTVVDRVITPHRAAVEKATGQSLEVTGNGTGKGLVDLLEGRCDAALVSEPLPIAVAAAAVAGKTVEASRLQFGVIGHDEIVFVVNPANPVGALTWEQLRDIHAGKIKTWRALGGGDQPITVYSDTPTGGTRALVKSTVMAGQEYGSSVVALTAVRKVVDMVSADPTGIGGVGKGFVDGRVKVLSSRKLERPLGFVTLGAPSAKIKALIDAFKVQFAK